jgi:hypothetical protein
MELINLDDYENRGIDLLPENIYPEEDKAIKSASVHDLIIGDLPGFLDPSGRGKIVLEDKPSTFPSLQLFLVVHDVASEVDVGIGGLLPEDGEEREAEDFEGNVDDGRDDEAGNPSGRHSSSSSNRAAEERNKEEEERRRRRGRRKKKEEEEKKKKRVSQISELPFISLFLPLLCKIPKILLHLFPLISRV